MQDWFVYHGTTQPALYDLPVAVGVKKGAHYAHELTVVPPNP